VALDELTDVPELPRLIASRPDARATARADLPKATAAAEEEKCPWDGAVDEPAARLSVWLGDDPRCDATVVHPEVTEGCSLLGIG
jgi:hypothetical protein